jgi:DNA-binding NtrC family response regulator
MIKVNYPLKVVLVDDDQDSLDLMEAYFKDNPTTYLPLKFTSPLDALEFIKKNEDVHLAIVDINMDEMKGDDVLEKINEMQNGMQVIIVTASDNLFNFTSSYLKRANGFIFKPFQKEHFLKVVEYSHQNIVRWSAVFMDMMSKKHVDKTGGN